MVVYDLPFGAEGRAGSGNPRRPRASCSGWQVSGITQFRSGPSARIDRRRLQPAERGHLLRRFQPGFSGPVRINGDYGDGDVLGTTPPTYIDRNAFVSPAPFTYGNTPRTLAHDLRNPNYFNQDLSIRRDFRVAAASSSWPASTCSTCSTMWCSAASRPTSPTQLRPGQLADEYAAGRPAESTDGVLRSRISR